MDNIKDENLKRLGKFIAEELIQLAKETDAEDWIEENTSRSRKRLPIGVSLSAAPASP